MIKRSVVAVVASVLLAAGSMLVVSPAYAGGGGPTCYHEACTGQDPVQTGCSSGAYTVLSGPALGGTLKLRWGPNCETNWTQFTLPPANYHTYQIWVMRWSDGLVIGNGHQTLSVYNSQGGTYYTDQIWSPGPAEACVYDNNAYTQVCISQPH
jgi:Protein of unknown function (DUF2690)